MRYRPTRSNGRSQVSKDTTTDKGPRISQWLCWGVIQLPVTGSLTSVLLIHPQSIRLGGAFSVAIHEFSTVAPRSFLPHFCSTNRSVVQLLFLVACLKLILLYVPRLIPNSGLSRDVFYCTKHKFTLYMQHSLYIISFYDTWRFFRKDDIIAIH